MRTLLALALLGLPSSALAAAPAAGPGRYVVFELREDGFRPLHHRWVTMAGRTHLGPAAFAAAMAAADGDDERVGVELIDGGGRVVFRDAVRVPRWIRAEGPADDGSGEFTGDLLPAASRPFVVRVPGGASRLRLSAGPRTAEFDLDVLAGDQGLALAGFAPPVKVETHLSGSPANRVDMLYIGDGYRSEDAALFTANANQVADQFFGITPYSDYRSHANVALVTVTSAEAGADHPPFATPCSGPPTCCGDPLMQSDPRAGQIVATALDATFCNSNIHRALVVNVSKALAAASAYPDWDEITVLVNDPTYGGTGGTVSTVSMNVNAVEVARHEVGHSFSRLADEYDSPFPGYPPCSDISGPACQPNVTDRTTRETIKWSPWIAPTTPIPTPETSDYAPFVGLFEGARYLPTGMYRPRLDCEMRALNRPFCQVCRQQFVMALYTGGWGTPSNGVDPIEPGSETPPPGATSGSFPGQVDFTTTLLAPTRGALSSRWSVDGRTIAGAAGGSFTLVPGLSGPYTVRLDVSDTTPFVHPAMAGTTLNTSRVWNVNVSPGGSGVSVASIDPTSGPAPGGTVITVNGGGFVAGTTVTVGGLPATDVVILSGQALTARTTAAPAGQLHAVTATLPSNATFTLPRAWLSDFIDVPQADPVHAFVERLVRNLVTGGCASGAYCRNAAVTRAQMSLFLLRSRYGAGYVSPPALGTVFTDVPAGAFAAAYIEDLAARGVTGGCGLGVFCPDDPVTRAAMAVFLLVTKHGTGYVPPPATGMFSDVPTSDPNAPWIEELAREGISAGCGGGRYCPADPVIRGDMAVFLSTTFGLP